MIRAIFSAHTHEDSFQLIRSKGSDDVAAVTHVVPALTTYTDENPSFRVYVADRKTFAILDYTQYRLYLNKTSGDKEPVWEVAYEFKKFFGVSSMRNKDFVTAVEVLKKNKEKFKGFVRNLWGEGPRGDVLLEDYNSARNFIMCRLNMSDMYEYLDCIGTDFGNAEFAFGYGFVARFFNAQWENVHYPQK